MLNICITADHELFFGRNFASEEEVFIRPTYTLMEVLEKHHIPLCLMTDVCSILRYKELEIDNSYVQLMEEQLRYAITRGHDVQLHIHPHWLESDYLEGQWKFRYANYRLHNYGFSESSGLNGRQIIAYGKRYLEDLLGPVDAGYKCVAFRAGGWCIQPEQEYLQALEEEGILIDTTVYFGGFAKDEHLFYDFRRVPQKPNWWVDPQKGLNYEAGPGAGHLLEVSIGSYAFLPLIGLKKLRYQPLRLKLKGRAVKSLGISMDLLNKVGRLRRMINELRHFVFQPVMFTFDSACAKVMLDLLTYYLKRFDCTNQERYICMIGHPKLLTEAYMKEIDKFCTTVKADYRDQVRFMRLRDIPLWR